MNCPVDNTELVMSDRQGVEIDYCPKCRGVWLDRGELDKIIDRSLESGPARPETRDAGMSTTRDARELSGGMSGKKDEHQRKGKKRSFLEDLFDF